MPLAAMQPVAGRPVVKYALPARARLRPGVAPPAQPASDRLVPAPEPREAPLGRRPRRTAPRPTRRRRAPRPAGAPRPSLRRPRRGRRRGAATCSRRSRRRVAAARTARSRSDGTRAGGRVGIDADGVVAALAECRDEAARRPAAELEHRRRRRREPRVDERPQRGRPALAVHAGDPIRVWYNRRRESDAHNHRRRRARGRRDRQRRRRRRAAAARRDRVRADASRSQRDGDALRRLLLREPRGSVAAHANLIVPSARDDCDAGFIIMEPTEYPPMSGSNTICIATVLLETGMLPMHEPETIVRLEAPGRRRRGCARSAATGAASRSSSRTCPASPSGSTPRSRSRAWAR